MSQPKIGALIGATALALHESALPSLQLDLPAEASHNTLAALGDAGVSIERGQRYAVHRGIAYVPVRGVLSPNSALLEKYLGWATYHGLAETLQAVGANDEVRAVAMLFDTAGGAVLGIQGAVEAVKTAKAAKPVHALVHPLAASAGYWLASQCTDISITPGSWVGSVGTMLSGLQPVKPGMGGDQQFILTSEHAGAKRPDLSTDEGKQLAQTRLDEMEAEFLAAVADGRGIDAAEVPGRMSRTESGTDGGDVFWGADAVSRGLADAVETVPEFLARLGGLYAPKPRPKSRAFMARAAAAKAQASL